jgi:hypothetical protein
MRLMMMAKEKAKSSSDKKNPNTPKWTKIQTVEGWKRTHAACKTNKKKKK